MKLENHHQPVLLNETLAGLQIRADGRYLDLTGGRGGHASAIAARLGANGQLCVSDRNEKAVLFLKQMFANDSRIEVLQSRFSEILAEEKKWDGILADLGISSPELVDPELGIGFQIGEAPLDMRLDHDLKETAADVLRTANEEELADIFYHLGGERAARKLARAIANDRETKDFVTTDDLRILCEKVLGKYYRGARIHPATKAFQALRIFVNKELEEIKCLVELAPARLTDAGRLVVIAFHEGEDRIVKQAFRQLEGQNYSLPSRKAIKPSREEEKQNPRSRSARLRILERKTT